MERFVVVHEWIDHFVPTYQSHRQTDKFKILHSHSDPGIIYAIFKIFDRFLLDEKSRIIGYNQQNYDFQLLTA